MGIISLNDLAVSDTIDAFIIPTNRLSVYDTNGTLLDYYYSNSSISYTNYGTRLKITLLKESSPAVITKVGNGTIQKVVLSDQWISSNDPTIEFTVGTVGTDIIVDHTDLISGAILKLGSVTVDFPREFSY